MSRSKHEDRKEYRIELDALSGSIPQMLMFSRTVEAWSYI